MSGATKLAPKMIVKTVDPTVNDDIADGYSVGDKWVNTTSDEAFVCLDNANGAAVWNKTTLGGEGEVTAEQLAAGAAHFAVTVAASNAPAKVKATADYVCDGTADNVQIQAALDLVATLGGEVKLSAGIFSLAKAAGQTTVTGTGNLTAGTPSSGTATLAVGSDVSNLAVGQLLRLSGGDYVGDTLEDRHSEGIYSIDTVNVGAQTIEFRCRVPHNYTGVTYNLLHYSIKAARYTKLSGTTIGSEYGTKLLLAAGADCDAIHVEGATTSVASFINITDMVIAGNYSNQTCAVGLSNGIVCNHNANDTRINSVFVNAFKGDGIVHTTSWGLTILDCVVEWNRNYGIHLIERGSAKIANTKAIENVRADFVITYSDRNLISNCQFGDELGTKTDYAVKIRGAARNMFSSCMFYGVHAATGVIWLGSEEYNTFSNTIESSFVRSTNGRLVVFGSNSSGNKIDVTFSGTRPYVVHPSYKHSTVRGAGFLEDCELESYYNNSGGAMYEARPVVVTGATAANGPTMSYSTVRGDPRVRGVIDSSSTINNGSSGGVQTSGKRNILCNADVGGGAITEGDELTCNGDQYACKAAAGDTVFAIALAALGSGQAVVSSVILEKFYVK